MEKDGFCRIGKEISVFYKHIDLEIDDYDMGTNILGYIIDNSN